MRHFGDHDMVGDDHNRCSGGECGRGVGGGCRGMESGAPSASAAGVAPGGENGILLDKKLRRNARKLSGCENRGK